MRRDSFWVAQLKRKKNKNDFFPDFVQVVTFLACKFFFNFFSKFSLVFFSNFFIQFFLCFVYKISLKNFLFHQRIYGVNFKRIDNGLNFKTISTTTAREIFKNIWKLVSLFLWSFITKFNERKKWGQSLVATAWNPPYISIFTTKKNVHFFFYQKYDKKFLHI